MFVVEYEYLKGSIISGPSPPHLKLNSNTTQQENEGKRTARKGKLIEPKAKPRQRAKQEGKRKNNERQHVTDAADSSEQK